MLESKGVLKLLEEIKALPSIRADQTRLQQLFENLFRNSIEHSNGDVTISLGALASVKGFYVEDDGPGIPSATRDEIFDFGYTTSENGSGFGLKIVEQIVQAHGWTITVSAGTDGGARFEITGVDYA